MGGQEVLTDGVGRARALRVSDVLLASLVFTVYCVIALVPLSIVQERTWDPGEMGSMFALIVVGILLALPMWLFFAFLFGVPALFLRTGTRPLWFVLCFAVAGLPFALVAQEAFYWDDEALAWRVLEVVICLAISAAGGALAGLVAWRRARWRADRARPTTYPSPPSGTLGGT
ncbi:hypothetical protein [Georgenia alba]|uniref:Integral membrane protein n=1 Tax=Georgenia alba TaxID=2233858 RepID=A0ABW2Q452_9MICO